MKKKAFELFILALFVITTAIFFVRMVWGGDEDKWICVSGNWVKHGEPSSARPKYPCDKVIRKN